jgi:ribosomal protein S18 acetylase RimI-like enzyme
VGSDIPLAAEMAVRLLPASVLTQLGGSFVKALYRAALAHPATIALKATDCGGTTIGFCLASSDTGALQHGLRRRLLASILRALLNPARFKLVPRFISSVLEDEPQPYVAAELLLLYVDDMCQRQGSGRAVVEQLETELRKRGVDRYRVAVRTQLTKAKAFYTATGFVFEQERLVLGEPMTYFVRDL